MTVWVRYAPLGCHLYRNFSYCSERHKSSIPPPPSPLGAISVLHTGKKKGKCTSYQQACLPREHGYLRKPPDLAGNSRNRESCTVLAVEGDAWATYSNLQQRCVVLLRGRSVASYFGRLQAVGTGVSSGSTQHTTRDQL